MNPLLKSIIFSIVVAMGANLWAAELIKTNPNDIYGVGTERPSLTKEWKLEPGLYELSQFNNKWETEYYVLVDRFINSEDKLFALMFPKQALWERRKFPAFFFQGRELKAKGTKMLTSLYVDNEGNLIVQSEMDRNAPVAEVILQDRRQQKYPFLLKGRNGALDGRVYGMRGSGSKRPKLVAMPSQGLFVSRDHGKQEMVVSNTEISFYNGDLVDRTFGLINLNGDLGKFATLTRSTFDAIAESDRASDRIEQIVTFVSGCWDREMMFVLKPDITTGHYTVEVFNERNPGLFEWLFPGRTAPRHQ